MKYASSFPSLLLVGVLLLAPGTEWLNSRRGQYPSIWPLGIYRAASSVDPRWGRNWAPALLAHAEPDDTSKDSAPAEETGRYCPTKTPSMSARASSPFPSHGPTCERTTVEIRNEVDSEVSVFWVDPAGQEVQHVSLQAGGADRKLVCRGHYWRARSSSASSSNPGRLLSELLVPADARRQCTGEPEEVSTKTTEVAELPKTSAEHNVRSPSRTTTDDNAGSCSIIDGACTSACKRGNTAKVWTVRACTEFPLPDSFSLRSSLGNIGIFEVSRGNLGIRMTEKQGVAFRQGLDLGGSVNITLEEAFTGKGIPVKLHRQVPCPACHGLGATKLATCDRCDGSGKLVTEAQLEPTTTPSASQGIHHADCAHVGGADGGFSNRRKSSGGISTAIIDDPGGICDSGYCSTKDETHIMGHHDYRGCGNHAPECNAGPAAVGGEESENTRENGRWTRSHKGAAQEVSLDQDHPVDAVILERRVICAKCSGTGKIALSDVIGGEEKGGPCKVCAGETFVEKIEELTVLIPPGAQDAYTALYPGMGHVNLTDLIHSTAAKEHGRKRPGDGSEDEVDTFQDVKPIVRPGISASP